MASIHENAAIAATMFVAVTVAARAADTVTADDTSAFPCGDALYRRFTVDAVDEGPPRGNARKILRYGVRTARAAPAFRKIRAWQAPIWRRRRPTMFYMFIGPDFLYADAFYSKATTYVLSALEPVGSVPISEIAARGVRSRSTSRALAGSILSFSFFITKLDEDRSERRAGPAAPCRSFMFSCALGQDIRDVV